MVADLFHASGLDAEDASTATGASTIGSSEAVMLGGLVLKWCWREKKTGDTPNLVLGSNVQVILEKFCRYFEGTAQSADGGESLRHHPCVGHRSGGREQHRRRRSRKNGVEGKSVQVGVDRGGSRYIKKKK